MKISCQKCIILLLLIFIKVNAAYAQNDFPAGDFWSLDAGIGMSNILVHGQSFQLIIDPKLWLSPALMVGSKTGINYSTDEILTFEGQVYLRWNFLRFGKYEKQTKVFIQGGIGLLAAYKGNNIPIDDVTETRGSILADAALGVTVPLTPRWHLEGMIRGGYPHIAGFSVTAGYKFPLPQKVYNNTEYREVIRTVAANNIVNSITISSIDFIIFGPDIGRYNIGIDRDAQQLNELVLNLTASVLKENPNYRVRIEGHANPHTISVSEADDLLSLSTMRANVVADKLRERGVKEEQIIIIAFGGTRTATNEWDVRNRNRRVELMVIQFDPNRD